MNLKIAIVLLVSVVLVGLAVMPYHYRTYLQVVSEVGEPIKEATVSSSRASSSDARIERGQTDENGWITLKEKTATAMHYRVEKEGFYTSTSYEHNREMRRVESKVLLREIIDPIPGYFNRVSVRLPEQGVLYGFDLLKGDLVEIGDGVVADFHVAVDFEWLSENRRDFHQILTVQGAGERSGFQVAEIPEDWISSEFKSHRKAPEDGYIDSIIMEHGRRAELSYVNKRLYFRSRVKLNDDSNIDEAMYCKFFGEPSRRGFNHIGGVFYDQTGVGFSLNYECNPSLEPSDRSLEFDRTQNLF